MKRFWDKVDKRGPDDCWPWKASCNQDGYGHFRIGSTMVGSHRVAFFLEHGRWPEPCGRHTCDRRPCCNPAHIIEGTHAKNMADMADRGRRLGICRGARNGRHTKPERTARGSRHGMAKLTERKATHIKRLRAKGQFPTALAARFGVDRATIYRVLKGQTWKHV